MSPTPKPLNSEDIPLDLVALLKLGKPVDKKIQVDFEIRASNPSEIEVCILAPARNIKSTKRQEWLRPKIHQYFSFDVDYWTSDEWGQMLGISNSNPIHWADRTLLLCRAQDKARKDKAEVMEILKNAWPFVLLPDGEIFSTRLLWPAYDSNNLLCRVPPMVLWFAYCEYQRNPPGNDTHKARAEWLNDWFMKRGGEIWQKICNASQKKKVKKASINPTPLITEENVKNYLKNNKLGPPRKI